MTAHNKISSYVGVLLILLLCIVPIKSAIPEPTEGAVRLEGGGGKEGLGRVEVYHEGLWGTVCDDFFDMNDARVVCRQLGYKSAVNVYPVAEYGRGSRIWLDNVRCDGNEERLENCGNNGWGFHNCDHSEDVSVQCLVEADDGNIRLVESLVDEDESSADVMQGYVQIFIDGKWRNICDKEWGITESLVVCHQLGFRAATNSVPTTESSNLSTDRVICEGNERRLDVCRHDPWVGGSCEEPVRVTCSDARDSVFDNFINPDKYCWTSWISTGSDGLSGNEVTLEAIRASDSSICKGVIPADFECRPVPINETTVICDRRQGLICDRTLDTSCNEYEFRLLCPCDDEDAPVGLCEFEGREFSAGEKRRDKDETKQCSQCTCSSVGEWLCDYHENFCPPKAPSCRRPCDGEPRVCVLEDWVIEWFYGGASAFCQECLFPSNEINTTHAEVKDNTCPNCITLDGVPRAVAVVNRQLPGPDTQVCEGDTVIVKVINNMKNDPSAGTTIHWHGMFMNGTQFMDGAFMVTQCPVPIGESFTYNFQAVPHGTHWWHSHAGLQRGDGVAGALIVRQPKDQDPNKELYDEDKYEHVVVVQDWSHGLSVTEFNKDFYGGDSSSPATILINGKGGHSTQSSKRPNICQGPNAGPYDKPCPLPTYEQFDVDSGKRYRFRVISTAAHRECAMRVSIDQHDITIVATDGASTKPFTCQSFVIFNAERYDFVVNANQEAGNYWMRVTGQNSCEGIDSRAIIHYTQADVGIPQSSDHKWNNSTKVDSCDIEGKKGPTKALYNLTSAEPDAMSDWKVNSVKKSNTYYIGLSFDKVDLKGTLLPQLNNVTFRLPSRPFLLQAPDSVEKGEICRLENREKAEPEMGKKDKEICGEGFCDCSHVLDVPLGEVVEIVFVNVQSKSAPLSVCHPMHLHGFNYRVVAQGIIPDDVTDNYEYIKTLNEGGKIAKRPVREAVQKDTVVCPENGYTVIQFRADNPGWWFLHCHFEMHLALGMTMVLNVDKEEGSVIPAPPINFPTCGNWADDRADEAETYSWSEELLGDIDSTKNDFNKAVHEKVVQTQKVLQEIIPRTFDPFKVTVNRLRTDPVTGDEGYFYYLFKVNSGDGTYVHLQYETPARVNPPTPRLVACYIDQNAETPLMPLDIMSVENECYIRYKKGPAAAAKGSVLRPTYASISTFIIMAVIFGQK